MKTQDAVVGIDIGSRTLQLALRSAGAYVDAEFANDAVGHREIVRFVKKHARAARIGVEATGNYGTKLCRALHSGRLDVRVINPRAVKAFARATMTRAKTDRVDARVLCEFVDRIDTTPWAPRRKAVDDFIAVVRHIDSVVRVVAREKITRHAAGNVDTPAIVTDSIETAIAVNEERVAKLVTAALQMAEADSELRGHLERFQQVPGIGPRNSMAVLAAFSAMPADLSTDQVVAWTGLDPRARESGMRNPESRPISHAGDGRIRRAMFLAAMNAIRDGGSFQRFYERLVARGKVRKVALIAVMRKLVVVLWSIYRSKAEYSAERHDVP